MPSDRYIDLTLGASGSTYTAPANGYFVLNKRATGTNQYIYLGDVENKMAIRLNATEPSNGQIFLPVRKNEKVNVSYTYGGDTIEFRFVYAEGEN